MGVVPLLLDLVGAVLGVDLVGVYTHHVPGDELAQLLVVTARDLRRDTKLALVQTLLVQLRYSEAEPTTFTLETEGPAWLRWRRWTQRHPAWFQTETMRLMVIAAGLGRRVATQVCQVCMAPR
jgi:hypothetical protein